MSPAVHELLTYLTLGTAGAWLVWHFFGPAPAQGGCSSCAEARVPAPSPGGRAVRSPQLRVIQ